MTGMGRCSIARRWWQRLWYPFDCNVPCLVCNTSIEGLESGFMTNTASENSWLPHQQPPRSINGQMAQRVHSYIRQDTFASLQLLAIVQHLDHAGSSYGLAEGYASSEQSSILLSRFLRLGPEIETCNHVLASFVLISVQNL